LSLVVYGVLAFGLVPMPADYQLSLLTVAIVMVWLAGFTVCYGMRAAKAALFPLLFLLLVAPLPLAAMDAVVVMLQKGSAQASYLLFTLGGVPIVRYGFRFELPGIVIEVAKECSSIHSGWALFITSLLVAHVFLRFFWTKACLIVLSLPIAVGTNAIRIVTIWFLGTHVDSGFLSGNLHRRGGILFSFVSLPTLLVVLYVLRKIERRRETWIDDVDRLFGGPHTGRTTGL
jgi:exosortase